MMDTHIEQFIAFCKVEKQLASRTLVEYEASLRILRNFLKETTNVADWNEITYAHLREFLHYLVHTRNNGATARAVKISCMKGFFKYLYHEQIIDRPVADRLIKPRTDQKLPVFLTQEECVRFIRVVRQKSRHKVRDGTIILTFLYSGLRITELCNLNITDIDLPQGTMKVTGKGANERFLPLSHELKTILRRYINSRKARLGVQHDCVEPLFVSRRYRRWNRINRRTVHDLFRHYAKEARMDATHFSAHKLRHTFATLLYTSGVELMELQRLLGHSNLHDTRMYTHTSVEQLRHAIRAHPLDMRKT